MLFVYFQDYKITRDVLGVGINGKVVECYNRKTGEKFALKVGINYLFFFDLVNVVVVCLFAT